MELEGPVMPGNNFQPAVIWETEAFDQSTGRIGHIV